MNKYYYYYRCINIVYRLLITNILYLYRISNLIVLVTSHSKGLPIGNIPIGNIPKGLPIGILVLPASEVHSCGFTNLY